MRKKLRRFLYAVAVCCACFAIPLCSAQAKEVEEGQVLGDNVNMRNAPSSNGDVLAKLPIGELVDILDSEDGWSLIEFNGMQGYIRSDLIFQRSVKGRLAYALRDDVNLRSGPGVSAYVIAHTEAGKPMVVKQIVGEWYFVEYEGHQGFVQKDLVSLTSKEGKSSSILLKPGMEGSEVSRVQTELSKRNFLDKKYITGSYGSITRDALREFQKAAGMEDADGIAGEKTLAVLFDPDNTVKKAPKVPTKKEDFYGRVQTVDWWKGGNKLLKRPGGTAKVFDIGSGKTWRIRRTGGTYHNDCAPMTAKDTAIMKSAFGGRWTHEKRPILVIIGSKVYAASIYGMPHGGDVQKNDNYPGMLCIHFTNSRTHGGNNLDSKHQGNIRYAYNKFNK